MELYFLNASENSVMPSLTSTSTVNNNTRHAVSPITVPLTSASDIKSWTARSPTASAPHFHALNRLLCGLRRSDRLSQRLHPPTRLEPQHGMDAPHESSVHRVVSPCRLQTRMSALVRLRSPTCFVALSPSPRDIHANSEFTDSLTLDATPAW